MCIQLNTYMHTYQEMSLEV
ncbi:hypothetical protein CSUI_010748 [Cystoisospora suis]|uniref:Uncharacterized protein n=1 Tax=Cystoisospora suis TaxID=483139 RepID=A0A2C6J9G5_9APIC|nr:hypothetical protein CSUI_010748 [Cystoisospora suis]